MMAQMKVHGISDKVMGLSSPRTMFFIYLEPVKVFCQIWQTRFFKVLKDAAFQGLICLLHLHIFQKTKYLEKESFDENCEDVPNSRHRVCSLLDPVLSPCNLVSYSLRTLL